MKKLVQFTKMSLLGAQEASDGNKYYVKGILGMAIVHESIKRKKPAGVVAVKSGRKTFEVVQWW